VALAKFRTLSTFFSFITPQYSMLVKAISCTILMKHTE